MAQPEHSHGLHVPVTEGSLGPVQGLVVGIILNLVIVAAEVIAGLLAGSLGLLSDAVHNFTDMAALGLSWFAFLQAKKPPTAEKTFGYHRTGILTALINSAVMVVITLWIFYEAYGRILDPQPVGGGMVMVVAALALLVNLAIVGVLRRRAVRDINIRSAVLHLLGDAATSAAVLLSGLIILLTGWDLADPLVSIALGLAILWGAWHIIKETLEIFLEQSPRAIDVDKLVQEMMQEDGVRDIHDIHVWTIGSELYALSCHVLVDDVKVSVSTQIIDDLKQMLARDFNIYHSTLEVEAAPCESSSTYCDIRGHGRQPGHQHD